MQSFASASFRGRPCIFDSIGFLQRKLQCIVVTSHSASLQARRLESHRNLIYSHGRFTEVVGQI